jgi:hypothetical protein
MSRHNIKGVKSHEKENGEEKQYLSDGWDGINGQ